MSQLKTFGCVVVLRSAMVNAAIAGPKIEARGEFGNFVGGAVGAGMGGAMGGMIGTLGGPWGFVVGTGFGGGIGAYSGAEIGDRVEDYIRGVDREPQAPREPTYEHYDRNFGYDR
ncbi:pantothenate kinase [Helicobacter acinonychis]|uniref:pantothenate kinase n=1 Tax=Helicobacter acinonychis TaxID=212 RepID=UPI000CF101BD|nr:pantothenate kinase [Helicobacter acinonychis]